MFGTENLYQYLRMYREPVEMNINKYGAFGKRWSLSKSFFG
jgi:hypothetical protein